MNVSLRVRPIRWLTVALLLSLILHPLSQASLYAASVPRLDEIRVALFIDSRGTTPHVTLSSSGAMSVGVRLADGAHSWLSAGSGPVRFSISGYSLDVAQTTNYNTASSVYAALASAGTPYIFAAPGQGGTVYHVRLGGFRTAEEASAAIGKIPVGAVADRNQIKVKGNMFLSAGTHSSVEAAQQQQAALAQQGIASNVAVYAGGDGKPVYAVWFGEAANSQQLEQARSAAVKAIPNLAVTAANDAAPYLLRRTDASSNASGIVHYAYNPSDHKVWVSASEGSAITVSERSGRSYRGSMEVTTYNGKLALINQLPFEQYLYGVVSSELGSSWPIEALKAQAVAARTFALSNGMKYQIAHVSDTTFDQAYYGKGQEFAQAISAVDATRGEVIMSGGTLITPFYSSNAGGMTADVREAWSSPLSYIASVTSPDQDAQLGKPLWYRVMLNDGQPAYISSDYARLTGKENEAGLPIVEVTGSGVNIRQAPHVDNTGNAPIAQANTGDQFVWIGEDIESNPFNWIRGPFSSETLQSTINGRSSAPVSGSLRTLEVTERGPSGRVTAMSANGQNVALPNADTFRGAMNGLPSTRFDVEETGKYTIIGAGGKKTELPTASATLHVQSADRQQQLSGSWFYGMNAEQEVRAMTATPQFRFIGLGFGHGIGMSQFGTKAFAELGYDYQKILQYYYSGVTIVKG